VIWWLLQNRDVTGIFNLGTGHARTWNDLIKAVFAAMDIASRIDYIEMPESIRPQYQYFTEAKNGQTSDGRLSCAVFPA